jgi:MFS transporter, SP family, sugar:H+ symporter
MSEKRDKSPPPTVTTVEASPAEVATEQKWSIKDHWKCLAACTMVSMCPFQYGLDFGLIGGLQAMVGFLKVKKMHTLDQHRRAREARDSYSS